MIFLDASSHQYKRVCPSVSRSIRPSVQRSVGPSGTLSLKRCETHLTAGIGTCFFTTRKKLFLSHRHLAPVMQEGKTLHWISKPFLSIFLAFTINKSALYESARILFSKMVSGDFYAKINIALLLYLYQIFNFLLGHLHSHLFSSRLWRSFLRDTLY